MEETLMATGLFIILVIAAFSLVRISLMVYQGLLVPLYYIHLYPKKFAKQNKINVVTVTPGDDTFYFSNKISSEIQDKMYSRIVVMAESPDSIYEIHIMPTNIKRQWGKSLMLYAHRTCLILWYQLGVIRSEGTNAAAWTWVYYNCPKYIKMWVGNNEINN